jgi:putative transposase
MVNTKNKLSIVKQCRLLEINRGGLYYKAKQENSENLEIMRLLDQQYFSTPFYGCRKLTFWLKDLGYNVNRKRVRRLMKIINWQTIYREPRTTMSTKEHKKYPYLLKGLKITHKNQVWATDITYIPMAKGFMYLTAIIDLHTRFILNWDLSNTMSTEWCTAVLQETIEKHGVPEIFNTDQGSQYTSEIHTQMLLKNGIRISMDGKERAIDNIFIERFWRTVKYENIYLQAYKDGISLRKGLKIYFKFYNTQRFHQLLDYAKPENNYYKKEVA